MGPTIGYSSVVSVALGMPLQNLSESLQKKFPVSKLSESDFQYK